jgi:hypothetical protein
MKDDVIITTDNTGEQRTSKPIDREEYERDLKERQAEHLRQVRGAEDWQPCLHDGCSECLGTGVKGDGSMCVHNISCSCPKCSPRC